MKKKSSGVAFHETRENESQRLQVHHANLWSDGAWRDRIHLCGELEKRNKLFRESRTKDCQEIQELRRRCCEESDRARQAKLDEWCVQQQRNPHTASQLLTQIRELQDRANSSFDVREFHDPQTASSSGAAHVPSHPLTIPSSRTMPCRASGLLHDTRNLMGISGHVFERLAAREGQPQTLFEDPKNLASSSRGLRQFFYRTNNDTRDGN